MELRKKISKTVYVYLREFFLLFFPKNCFACGTGLNEQEEILCTDCLYNLPRTGFHLKSENELAKLFWGLSNIKSAAAYFYFSKGSKYRHLIHMLKYGGHPEIGVELAKHFASEFVDSEFNTFDIIIPVPLHYLRQRKRGYNQSEMIAKGLSEILDKPVNTQCLLRKVYTKTQTKKNLEERRKNVESVFEVKRPELIENKHILLVDDVITTGSTLMACADELNKVSGVKVSVASLGFAAH